MLPACFYSCKKCKHDRLETSFERGRAALLKEVDIIEIIKSSRYFHAAIRVLLDKKVRMKIKKQSHYHVIKTEKQENGIDFIDDFCSSSSDEAK